MLRRRWDPLFEKDVYEIKLEDDFLMSSLFTAAEVEMSRLTLANLSGADLDIAVGGLGLGFTAQTVLEYPHVRSMVVVEALDEVISWHRRELIPAGITLATDPRCRLIHGDFFGMLGTSGIDPEQPQRRFDGIIVDIDHSPSHVLHPSHAPFYEVAGLRRLEDLLRPGGVFTLWSNDPPDDDFVATLGMVFTDVTAEIVGFHNPLQGRESTNTVYVARTKSGPG